MKGNAVDLPKSLEFVRGRVRDLERRSRDAFLSTCPKCGKKELRIWELDLEVRCGSCSFWTFGEEDFIQRLESLRKRTVTSQAKGKEGICSICGGSFEIPAYIRRPKQYCSPRCRKRAQRTRERGHNLGETREVAHRGNQ